jgi:chemotaxis protein CheD
MATAAAVLVPMSEIHVLRGGGQLTCMGLGSCVAVCALDPVANVGGMVHVMLPGMPADKELMKPGKYANTGLAELISRLEELGALRERLICAIAGGAQILQFGGATSTQLNVGERNAAAVGEQIDKQGLRCVAHDLGGNLGRTVSMTIETGEVRVRTVSGGEHVLCNLR